ncbi:MAG: hypothetical protein OEV28_07735 [Nitrospirota bacterium]|nr:hypothetical protein [Nitrospirota bacterium]
MDKIKLVLAATAILVIVGCIGAITGFATNYLPAGIAKYMQPLLMSVMLFGIPLFLFSRWSTNYLRKMTPEELKAHVFSYHKEYFDFIGADNEAVRRFKELTEKSDLDSLRKEWKSLETTFRRLERAAGHEGRSLIMDYYLNHSYAIKLLNKKLRKTPHGRLS